jgi:hypothetical protein
VANLAWTEGATFSKQWSDRFRSTTTGKMVHFPARTTLGTARRTAGLTLLMGIGIATMSTRRGWAWNSRERGKGAEGD